MTEHEKVLKGLECHRNGFCFACPYDDDDTLDTTNCKRQLVEDAIALLKGQPEIVRCKDCVKRGRLSCPKMPVRPEDWFCADGEAKEDG